MARAKIVVDGDGKFYGIQFVCPGCAEQHDYYRAGPILPVQWLPPGMERSPHVSPLNAWGFNGNLDRPTFTPSVLSRWEQWMGDNVPKQQHICHSFVRDGRIEYLNDSTHSLAGQTVDLPEIVRLFTLDELKP